MGGLSFSLDNWVGLGLGLGDIYFIKWVQMGYWVLKAQPI